MSFDSLAQAAFFASRGSEFSGLGAVVLLADATNGALLNWFASRSDRLARHASHFSSGFIALIALLTDGAGLLRGLESGFAQTWDDMGLWIGVGLLASTSLVYAARIVVQRARLPSTVAAR